MKELDKKELKQMIQSGHINFLIGAGCSTEYLNVLNNIENEMNQPEKEEQARKKYYQLIKLSKDAIKKEQAAIKEKEEQLEETRNNYEHFLQSWLETVSKRSLDIVNKQVNIFTTNFDMFLEDSCERLGIPYNDGFSGRIKPKFDVANFNKIEKYKSLQFDNTSAIPLFNIIKLHGSISWKIEGKEIERKEIVYSDGSHIADDLNEKTGDDFKEGYKKIAVINPTAEKHFETTLDTNYASMLRKFSLELEKENSLLMVIGFSLEDKHIKTLLYGVMKSNPTLVVCYFSYPKYDTDKLEEAKHPNLYVISPENNPHCKKECQCFNETARYLDQICNPERRTNIEENPKTE
ncbi:MAG: SIR2 family protein [Chlamydiota bacterium]